VITIYENMSIWVAFIRLQTSIWLVLEVYVLAGCISVFRDGFYAVTYLDKEAFTNNLEAIEHHRTLDQFVQTRASRQTLQTPHTPEKLTYNIGSFGWVTRA